MGSEHRSPMATSSAVNVVLLEKASLLETVSVVTHKAGAGGTLWKTFGLPSVYQVGAFRSGWVRKKRQLQQLNANYSLLMQRVSTTKMQSIYSRPVSD